MTVKAFTGGAGCGKTHQLMELLDAHLKNFPLKDGQRVLALTFMHGSRRRLEERIEKSPVLRKKADCSTIDSFAWRLVRRWLSLATALGFSNITPEQYERVCDAAGALLSIDEVCGWVVATFPVLLVDEAQDMTVNRLQIVKALANRLEVFAAADEFQCLKEELRPNPACVWLNEVSAIEELTKPQRTNVGELLDAAAAVRRGDPPVSDKLFMVQLTAKPALAGAWLNGNLRFYGRSKSVAVITPTLGVFSQKALAWAAENSTKNGHGPYTILWEESESKAADNFIENLPLQDENDIASVLSHLAEVNDPRVTCDVLNWMDIQRRTKAKTIFSKDNIHLAIKQIFAQRRRKRGKDEKDWRGMTVHGAKNREFDNVIVLWPAAVGGSDDQKRRLLYNAITRAKERCLVLVQAKSSLIQAPFS